MREVWRRLGRTDSINWIVITVVATLQFVGSFVITNSNAAGRELLFVGCVVLSVLVVIVMLLFTRYVIIPRVTEKARPFVIIVMLQLTAFTRSIVFDQLLVSLDMSTPDMLLSRIYGSQFNIFVAGIVVSSLVSMARDFSENNSKLVHTLSELRIAQEDIELLLEERRTALVSSIRAQLESALSSVTGKNVNADAQHLKSLIDDVVRPISHRLGREFSSVSENEPSAVPSRIRWSSVTKHALETNPIHPLWLTVWTAFVSFQVIATAAGSNFLLPYLSGVVVFALWFMLSRFVWKKTTQKLGLFPRAIVFSMLMLVTPLVVNSLLELEFGLEFFNSRVVISAALYFVVMSWSLALIISVSNLLKATNRELVEATTQLRRRVITDNVSARHFEQAVSHVLHGPIQDAIAASLKRIQSLLPDALPGAAEGDLIRQHIEHALELLNDSPVRDYSVKRGVSDLASLWAGVVEIDVECEKTTIELLDASSTTSSIVIEVIREAVSNAIRHGDASEIEISIALSEDESDVIISVSDNGTGLTTNPEPGIGTRLLDDMTLEWSRVAVPRGVLLTASVPL
ncbi:ATP-binding protein [Aurantimicrobium photophilum]|uniref:Nitrate/nitrite sensor protein NarQ n=1 Tax=Aurantimicrobium photophilum TaxID=1987356 RepID=A0A2Z3RXV1_9MICO|nr:ATP-binding protein [Aurantimicrobium photophilum]AWR20776.1 nitrate/nitrite sensor protein NarQ [Aurantimicrobium photophilum]